MSRVKPVVQEELDLEEDAEDEIDEELDDSPDEAMEGESEYDAGTRIIEKYTAKAKSPLKAIRAFCIICMGGYVREVARCTAPKCVLYPMRMGRNPFHAKAGKPPTFKK